MKMKAEDLAAVLQIIGDLGILGYRVSLHRLSGNSWQQCAQKFGTTRKMVRYSYSKCVRLGHDKDLVRIFGIQKKETFVPESSTSVKTKELHRNKKLG